MVTGGAEQIRQALGDFLRRDVVFKVVPWFTLYSAGKLTTADSIPGIDFGTLANTVFGVIVAAIIGSIGSSVYQLFGLSSTQAKDLASGGTAGDKPLTTLLGPENPRTAPMMRTRR